LWRKRHCPGTENFKRHHHAGIKKSPAHRNKYIIDSREADKMAKSEVYFVIGTAWGKFWSYVGSKNSNGGHGT